eukprot:TRINITY_DN103465_c0_g1_i1.p2 TRINITY_DN103465_c0_g1~~TRINITY_DN103465_c0_g1_i1.p2  ORF type:complete len:144 (-),score=27.95 TRINITY_DN103465_c0_g1_i1:157-588(-)
MMNESLRVAPRNQQNRVLSTNQRQGTKEKKGFIQAHRFIISTTTRGSVSAPLTSPAVAIISHYYYYDYLSSSVAAYAASLSRILAILPGVTYPSPFFFECSTSPVSTISTSKYPVTPGVGLDVTRTLGKSRRIARSIALYLEK